MPWFIKTEEFTQQSLDLMPAQRHSYISKHRKWVISLKSSGHKVASGYLADENHSPGGGGLLVIQANTFEEAEIIVKEDPMITANLVNWKLQEWIPVSGQLLE